MLLARLAINPVVQGSKLAVDIFSFVTNFFSPHVGAPKPQSYETCPQPACRAGTHASISIKLMVVVNFIWYIPRMLQKMCFQKYSHELNA